MQIQQFVLGKREDDYNRAAMPKPFDRRLSDIGRLDGYVILQLDRDNLEPIYYARDRYNNMCRAFKVYGE